MTAVPTMRRPPPRPVLKPPQIAAVPQPTQPKEEPADFTGKTFAVKLPPRLTARVLAAMEDIEIDSNAGFLRKCIEVAMPIMQEHAKGTTFTGTREDGSTFEVMIAG